MPPRQPRARVYVPATTAMLVELVQSGSMPTRGIGHAVTPQVRAAGPDGDDDEWEFEAFGDAAAACVALLNGVSGGLRRVVVSVDLDPADVAPADGPPPSVVAVPDEVSRRSVAAVHVDDEHAAAVVARVLDGAPTGLLDDVALDWFDASEIEALVDQLSRT
ncbi:MAG: hypothetical protein WCA82_08020 [Jiangellales bacterium]